MNDVVFPEPVILQIPGLGPRKVVTSFEAMECLANEWPLWARGKSWRSANSACRDALDGWRSGTSARRSFVKAARRADLLQRRQRKSAQASHRPIAGARSTVPTGTQ